MSSNSPPSSETFTLRWRVIGTGLIASWFASDLLIDPVSTRNETHIKHTIQAVGSSSLKKAHAFVEKHITPRTSQASPACYGSYHGVYEDPNVDIVYIATPHALHLQNALEAIRAGKHVLCEKPMAVNEKDAAKVIDAAKAKGLFLMEAVWTRLFPVARELQRLIHVEKAIGNPTRAFFDFGLDMPLDKQPTGSRVADITLGAGSLLDIGIYSLTWARLVFHSDMAEDAEEAPAGRHGHAIK